MKIKRANRFVTVILFVLLASKARAVSIISSLDCRAQGCSNVIVGGDTNIFTAWGPTGSTTYNGNVVPGMVYGTFNDGGSTRCDGPMAGGNINVLRLTSLDLGTPANTVIEEVNCMGSYGYGGGSAFWPPGPNGQCNSAGYNTGCSWKSGGFTSVNGVLYLQILRQEGGPYYHGHDSTLIKSNDGGVTWFNPAHVGNAPDPGGDATKSPEDPSYVAAMLWPEPVHPNPYYDGAGQPIDRLSFIQYCQDESINCPDVDNSQTYLYALSISGNFANYYLERIKKIDLPRLRASDWDYYYCPDYSPEHVCDGMLAASWTKTLSDITPIRSGGGPGIIGAMGSIGQAVYLKDFGEYLFLGSSGTSWDITPSTASHPWGPWTSSPPLHTVAHEDGFPSLMLFTAKLANPRHLNIVMASDSTDNPPDTHSGTIFFDLLDVENSVVKSERPGALVYPNPWRREVHSGKNIIFDGLKTGTSIKIFSSSGHLLKELRTNGPSVLWDLSTDNGDKLKSGIYTYRITDGKQDPIAGKIAILGP